MQKVFVRSLTSILPKKSGRDMFGHVSVRHQGGREKRLYRAIDWKREKDGVPARVAEIRYDPNRSADIALLVYRDGEKRYILAPQGLHVKDMVHSGPNIEAKPGNCMPMGSIPVGTLVHNLEIKPGRGAQMVRSAGNSAVILSRDGDVVQVKLPSGEVRMFAASARATVGQLTNEDRKNQKIGKAGRARHMGKRPEVRGVAMNPRSHPHGGGEGRSGIGMKSPKSPWGKRTLGKRTRALRKYSDRFIVQRRKKK